MRNNKGYFIEKGRTGNDIFRNMKCEVVAEGPPKKAEFDRNGNVKEYRPDGGIYEKDNFGSIVEYTRSGKKIKKDEYGQKIPLNID